ncbi:hypothetical protein Tco_0744972 [Tanacetum coccineum]
MDESRCYRYTLDVQEMSRDAIVVHEMFNREVDMLAFAPQQHESAGGLPKTKLVSHSCSLAGSTSAMEVLIPIAFVLPGREHECNESFKLGRPSALSFAPQLHESAGGLPSLKLSLHSCSLPGSTNAMGIETSIALVLLAREHECDTSFVLGRPPALS